MESKSLDKNKKAELEEERIQIEKAKKDNKEFAPLYEKYHQKIYAYIRSKINSNEDAEDITAQVFEKVMNNLRKFQWQGISLSAWIYRIARNAMNDFLRSKMVRKTDDSSEETLESTHSEEEAVLDTIIRSEKEDELLEAISQLPEDEQYLVYYKYFEALSNIKIAEILGITETNVGTRLHRVRGKLRKLLSH